MNFIFEHLQGLAELLHAEATPILLATGGLLALISLRNGHISDRARGNVNEALHQVRTPSGDPDWPLRKEELHEQNARFLVRYHNTSMAFIYTLVAFVLFMPPGFLGYRPQHLWITRLAGFSGVIAGILFFFSLFRLAKEFDSGIETLCINNRILDSIVDKSVYRKSYYPLLKIMAVVGTLVASLRRLRK